MRFGFFKALLVSLAVLVIGFNFNAQHTASANAPIQSANLAAAASSGAFDATLTWVEKAGYLVMFGGMLLEGPIVNAAAAFAAALGYFNIWIVVLLAILADLVGDIVYYAIGHFARRSLIERFGKRFGLTRQRMHRIETLLHKHPGKTLVVLKLMPVIPTPGLMIVGATGMPITRFVTYAILIIVPKVVVFSVLGYYFGAAYDSIATFIDHGEVFIVVAVAVVLSMWWIYNKSGELVAGRLETI